MLVLRSSPAGNRAQGPRSPPALAGLQSRIEVVPHDTNDPEEMQSSRTLWERFLF